MEKYKILGKKILIYGAGSVGKIATNTFHQSGIDVEAYIDKRADTIKESNNKIVFSMEKLQKCIQDKDNYVIVFTIRNVFEHSSLAEQFFSMGFKNLIYKPATVLRGNQSVIQDSINFAYEQITGKFTVPEDEIACYEKEVFAVCDYGLCKDLGKAVVVKLPAELLFSNLNPKALIMSCQNFYSNYIAVNLYESFNGCHREQLEEQWNQYIDRFALPGAKVMGVNTDGNWKELLIDSRQKVYYEMEYKLWMDYNFFIQNCPEVGLRKGKGFELVSSGKNRISFLVAKGFRYIPVKIKKEYYQKYINNKAVQNLVAYLNRENIEIFAPIPHPFFYRINVIAPDYPVECVKPIARLLAEQVYIENKEYCFHKYRLAAVINDEGYVSRYFKMLGYEVERIITKNHEFCELEDKLFYYNEDNFKKSDENFYCAIIRDKIPTKIVNNIINRTSKFLIVVSSSTTIKKHFIVDKSEFRLNKKIFETAWAGEIVLGNLYERIK
ncbi:MAG: hypothetical protein NC118_05930 [Eubacterium sp.]|nr:hypothetical protein [Eubacterium sp.]